MKVDTLGVQAFISVADHASFQRAADELHISQTAVTRRLQNLETHLGVKLIERTTRAVGLTPIGSDLLPQVRRLVGELSNALADIVESGKARRGDVSIACVPTAGIQFLPRIIQEYSGSFPDNRITILDHSSAAVAEAVVRREAELGINVAQTHHPDLISTRLLTDQFAFDLPRRSPAGQQEKFGLETARAISAHLCGRGQRQPQRARPSNLGGSKIKLRLFYEVRSAAPPHSVGGGRSGDRGCTTAGYTNRRVSAFASGRVGRSNNFTHPGIGNAKSGTTFAGRAGSL